MCSDQQAVDQIQGLTDPQEASEKLLQYALGCVPSLSLSLAVSPALRPLADSFVLVVPCSHGTTDNLTCMVVALNYKA